MPVSGVRDLFHPDYDRRLWHLTRSADPTPAKAGVGARGLLGSSHRYRRWGIAPRPENAATLAGCRPNFSLGTKTLQATLRARKWLGGLPMLCLNMAENALSLA
jgi:hypothetical protein